MQRVVYKRAMNEAPTVCICDYDRNLEPGITCGPLTRNIYIFECNVSGYGSVVINGREFPVRPGDCYILLPGDTIIHKADKTEPRNGVWCGVDGMQIGRVLAQAGITSEQPYAPPELFSVLAEQIFALADMKDDNDPGAELRRSGYIYNFLGILLSKASAQGRSDWLPRVIGHMESFYNQPISVEVLARTAHLERSYFSVKFKCETGMTPHAYLNSLRVRKACELIKNVGCGVAQAAELVGLDPRNFSRLFRSETGMTPREFLKCIDGRK